MTISTLAKIDNAIELSGKETTEHKSYTIKYPKIFGNSGLQGYKIFLDRYTLKAPKGDLDIDDLVLAITNKDPKWPQKEIGFIQEVYPSSREALIWLGDGENATVHFDLI